MSGKDEIKSVGWDAIDAALAPIYGSRQPKHFGTVLPMMLGGKDPLQGISAYKNLEPLPHFHFVTYGFSELYEKESDNLDLSGYGFELTFRLACGARDEDPPVWALNFLQNIARYVFSTGNQLAKHHHIDLNGPIALGEDTQICCIALATDPQLGDIETENGRVTFLQVVGLCADEYELIKEWDCGRMLEQVGRQFPLLVTELKRHSILTDPAIAAEIRSVADKEGSSQGEVFVTVAEWQTAGPMLKVKIGATAARDVVKLLKARLTHSKPFVTYGPKHGIVFQPDPQNSWTFDQTLAVLSLSPAMVQQMLESLKAERGIYQWPSMPDVVVEVVPTEIKDQKGNIVRVIG